LSLVHLVVYFLEEFGLLSKFFVNVLGMVVQVLCDSSDFIELFVLLFN
jgi:hypothetical protein